MTSAMTIPVEVKPDAAERVAELGLRQVLEEMVEHAKQDLTDLKLIEVSLAPHWDGPGTPMIYLTGWKQSNWSWKDPGASAWYDWATSIFPPEVFQWFSLVTWPWEDYGR